MTKNNIEYITINGARVHNLNNVSLQIPRNKLVVITGLSGSGKSSLAFDTIYAEGQRRYVESLSSYARQFLGMMSKPDVDNIEGLSPAISIEQKTRSKNPRSTVGTITEIYDYLRLLYARVGKQLCYKCHNPIQKQSVQQIIQNILLYPKDSRIQIIAPIIRHKKGEFKSLLHDLTIKGFIKVRINNKIYQLPETVKLNKYQYHNIDVIIDRLIIDEKLNKQRLLESVELALKLGQGLIKVDQIGAQEYLFNQHLSCVECDLSYHELEPKFFSFNSPLGACESCDGLGTNMKLDIDRIIPDKTKSLAQGCLLPVGEQPRDHWFGRILKNINEKHAISYSAQWKKLPKHLRLFLLYGIDQDKRYAFKYEGLLNYLDRRFTQTHSSGMRDWIQQYMSIQTCKTCNGSRLKPQHQSVYINEHSIFDLCNLSIKRLNIFFKSLKLNHNETKIADSIKQEIMNRLEFLENVGLDYLSLSRTATTLSGGESQRIKLAAQIGLQLVGVLYILDEPSIGLHSRDNDKLISTLLKLRDLGNTVIVVEHDSAMMEAADWIIDIGPKAGIHGGNIIAEGSYKSILKHPDSITGKYLSGEKNITVNSKVKRGNDKVIKLNNASGNNLKNISISFPLNHMICITGVSGSGKSSLVNQTLYPILAREFYNSNVKPLKNNGVDGLLYIDKVIDINQSPIGRTPRSNPATFTGVFTYIRDLFSKTLEAKTRGYQPGRFSFNVKGGRCEACQGMGLVKVEMHFLPDMYVTCDECNGKRFNRETLDITYNDNSIFDVLDMTVDEAYQFFNNNHLIIRKLETLISVGLGYIKLGQPAATLSGGESQRIKLSKELSKIHTGRTVYILDEPTTGLHFHDIQLLLNVLHNLTDKGNTVIIIEHNLDVIKTADWIIDLGLEGGNKGGEILFEGRPKDLINFDKSYTGKFLKKYLIS